MIVVLQLKEHDVFTRKDSDLYMTHKLGITEALCGCEFAVKQLDGRDLVVRNPPGNVLEPGNSVSVASRWQLSNCYSLEFL